MKKFAFFLAVLPFLLIYSNSNAVVKKVKTAGNPVIVNFSGAASGLNSNYMVPDTTDDTTTTNPDTLIKS
jgi:hypothetical protein